MLRFIAFAFQHSFLIHLVYYMQNCANWLAYGEMYVCLFLFFPLQLYNLNSSIIFLIHSKLYTLSQKLTQKWPYHVLFFSSFTILEHTL